MPNPVVHFEIMGNDASRCQQWYSDVFGWTIDPIPIPGAPDGQTYGFVTPQAGKGIGGGITSIDAGKPTVHIYVEVDDLQAYLTKIERAGGKTIMPPRQVLNMATIALFSDPDGVLIGLVKAAAEP
jgi:predicted enzyme related to lactoylglutathione lyase